MLKYTTGSKSYILLFIHFAVLSSATTNQIRTGGSPLTSTNQGLFYPGSYFTLTNMTLCVLVKKYLILSVKKRFIFGK